MLRSVLRAGFALVIIAFVFSASVVADEKSVANHPRVKEALNLVEIWIESQMDYERLPGISIAVVHDQDLLWAKGFGYSDMEKMVPTTPDTIYSICSISKLFTSIALMQLRDAGKLQLDDPVSKHLDWFKIEKTHPDAPPITVLSLLRHSSGLPRESDIPYWTGPDFPFPEREQVIEKLPQQKILYEIDTYFQYSNLGLTLAGEIVAAVSGQDYNDYVKENILDPLGLTDTTPYLREDLLGGQMASGYGRWPREGEREKLAFFQARGITPAAGFASTAKDLAKFASWQFRLLEKGGNEILNAYTLKEMHRVHWLDPNWKTTWGVGFAVWKQGDNTFVGHSGGCPGYQTQLMLCPKDKIAIVFMCNAIGAAPGMHTERAYGIVAPAIKTALDSDAKEDKSAPENLEKYTGLYSGAWSELSVFYWKGSLGVIYLPSSDPAESITELKHTGEHVFTRVRKDGELGEEIIFELDESGNVKRLLWHSNYMTKVR